MTLYLQHVCNKGANIALSIWHKVLEFGRELSVLLSDTICISRNGFLLNRMKRYLELFTLTVLKLCKDFGVQQTREYWLHIKRVYVK